MEKVSTYILLPKTLRDELDKKARKVYKNRTTVIVEALVEWLARQDEK